MTIYVRHAVRVPFYCWLLNWKAIELNTNVIYLCDKFLNAFPLYWREHYYYTCALNIQIVYTSMCDLFYNEILLDTYILLRKRTSKNNKIWQRQYTQTEIFYKNCFSTKENQLYCNHSNVKILIILLLNIFDFLDIFFLYRYIIILYIQLNFVCVSWTLIRVLCIGPFSLLNNQIMISDKRFQQSIILHNIWTIPDDAFVNA